MTPDTPADPLNESAGSSAGEPAGTPISDDVRAQVAEKAAEAAPEEKDLAVAGRNAVTLGISLVATWTVAFLVRFQLPRFLGPERFGAFNFAENFAAAFFVLAELGIDTYIIKEISVRPKHASEFFGGLLLVRSLVSVVLLLVMGAVLKFSDRTLELQIAGAVFALTQLVTINNNSLAALLQASTKVRRLAIANVMSKVLWGAGLAVAIFLKLGLAGLALPLLISEAVKTVVLYPAVRKAINLEIRLDSAVTKTVLLASVPYFLNSGAVNLGGRLNVAVLAFVTPDKKEVGWFGAASNLASLAMFLSPLLWWVLMPLLARAKDRSVEEMYEILRRAIEALLVIVIPFTLLVSLGADLWVHLAFGAKFDEAAMSLRILSLNFILIYLAMTLSVLLFMVGKNWSVTVISAMSVFVRPLLLFLFVSPAARWIGPGGGAFGASVADVGAMVFSVSASFYAVGRGAVDARALRAIFKSIAVAIGVAILHGALFRLGHVRLVVDMVVYVIAALALRVASIGDIMRFVRMLMNRRKKQPA